MSRESWFVKYERDALQVRALDPMPDPLSYVFGGPQPDMEKLRAVGAPLLGKEQL